MRRAILRAIMLTQKFDCRCFYRTSKRAKSTSNKLVRRALKKEIENVETYG